MDQRELHLQHLGICYKLYNFIIKTLASQASKKVTLGRPSHYGSSSSGVQISSATLRASGSKANKVLRPETPREGDGDKELPPTQGLFGDSIPPSTEHAEEKNKPFSMKIDGLLTENVLASLPQAPKKMVSINDDVEEIILPRKMKKMSKSFKKSNSLDPEDPKPLRSILKVGSNLNDKSNSSC